MKKHILIVDDDISLNSVISDYLIGEGFEVSLASSVQFALQVINSTKPDMIITDIMMPSVDGYEFLKTLRLNNELFGIPIILLTAKGMTEDRIKGYDLGCNAYLTKPFDPQELLSIIQNLFNNINLLQTLHNNDTITSSQSSNNVMFTEKLTSREMTILKLVAKGYKNKEIAQQLQVSTRNVEKYVSRLLSKTSTRNRTELAKLVINGIL